MSRLFPAKNITIASISNANSFSWNDSATELTLGSSMASMEENEFAALALIKDIDQAIVEQTKHKGRIEGRLESIIILARARYEGGSHIGAILSMRKWHRNRTRKAYLAAARYQLVEMRQRIESEMNRGRFQDLDIAVLRNACREIMLKVHAADQVPAPCDDDLLRELYHIMNMAEI